MKLNLKQNILTLIIGILIGSIITTGVFLVLKSNETSKYPNITDMSSFRERKKSRESISEDETSEVDSNNITEGE